MKRIGLFLDVVPNGGGTFQYTQAMLDAVVALPAKRFTVVVVYTSNLWQEHLNKYNVQKFLVSKRALGDALGSIWKMLGLPLGIWRSINPFFHPIAKLLIRQRCDLWIFPSQDGRGYEFPVPALISIHDLMHRYERRFPEVGSAREYRNREKHYRNVCKWSLGVLVDSEVGRKQVMESYGLQKNRIHPLPYIAPPYVFNGDSLIDFDQRYQLPEKFLFYPAKMWAHKNHVRLIEAVAQLKASFADLKVVFSGSQKGAFNIIMKHVAKLGLQDDIVFLGHVPDEDMLELYRRARALVMPTFFGPTNIPPLEAFAVGCPVAISNRYGMPEQTGDAALLFDPESVEELAYCIRRLWTDDSLCQELVKRGHIRAISWGPRQFAERLECIIEEVTTAS